MTCRKALAAQLCYVICLDIVTIQVHLWSDIQQYAQKLTNDRPLFLTTDVSVQGVHATLVLDTPFCTPPPSSQVLNQYANIEFAFQFMLILDLFFCLSFLTSQLTHFLYDFRNARSLHGLPVSKRRS